MITVRVHTILGLKQIIGQREADVSMPEGSTVHALFSQLVTTWGDKLAALLFEPGSTRPLSHIRLMVNGRDIGFLDGTATVLEDRDKLIILPPVAGG